MEPCFLTATEAARQIRDGKLTSEALIRSCIERIEDRDPTIRAWIHMDKAHAIAQARELDKRPSMGPLHGLPFGVKDIIDTCDMPTTQNSPLYQGHRPAKDAACVGVVRGSGAVILGKTDTVEFASGGRKAATRNPFNLGHTPGGSSSGSGAAVGDFQVQLAFGTQTGGSHIRPASFNGIYGLKPTWGVVSREGAKHYSNMLDTIGWYGRSVADLALVAEAFRLPGLTKARPVKVKGLKIALCKTPYWSKIEPGGKKALKTAVERLEAAGAIVEELKLPKPFGGLYDAQTTIQHGEGGAAFLPEHLIWQDRLHDDFRAEVENFGTSAKDMAAAYDLAGDCRRSFERLVAGYDAVLTPAAPGEAPEGLHTTGSWIFNAMWTLLHVPCLAIPCIIGAHGLPVGIQIVGPRFGDADLLRVAEALAPVLDVDMNHQPVELL